MTATGPTKRMPATTWTESKNDSMTFSLPEGLGDSCLQALHVLTQGLGQCGVEERELGVHPLQDLGRPAEKVRAFGRHPQRRGGAGVRRLVVDQPVPDEPGHGSVRALDGDTGA